MNEVKHLTFPKILIFSFHKADAVSNPLKDYLLYLKFQGLRGIIDFSYSHATDSLHSSLSIKENFVLEAVPVSLIKNSESNLNEILSSQRNPYLMELIANLGCLNRVVKTLNPNEIKLVTLVKTILSKSEYVFLLNPEIELQLDHVKLIKECIFHEAINSSRKFFISPSNQESWVDISTHYVNKCSSSGEYLSTKNELNTKMNQLDFSKPYKFKLLKQAS
jgi:hypothetical protein